VRIDVTTTYRADTNLRKPGYNDSTWNVPLDLNFDDLDASPLYGGLCCSLTEVPSSSLNVKVAPGRFRKADGTLNTFAGSSSQALTASATNSVYLTDAGVLTVSTAGWPTVFHVPLAVAVCGTGTVTSLTDSRVPLVSCGAGLSTLFLSLSPADSAGVVVVQTGGTNGVQIGSTFTDKVGFWGHAPAVVQTVTGSRGGNAALASLLTALANVGIVIDSSSA
jgi:hypothetical protein